MCMLFNLNSWLSVCALIEGHRMEKERRVREREKNDK